MKRYSCVYSGLLTVMGAVYCGSPASRDNNGVTQTKWTIQECYAWIISENGKVGNYRSQGVTGVRFMDTLGGGFFSTAFEDNGLVNLEEEVWSGPHGLASGNPAATGR